MGVAPPTHRSHTDRRGTDAETPAAVATSRLAPVMVAAFDPRPLFFLRALVLSPLLLENPQPLRLLVEARFELQAFPEILIASRRSRCGHHVQAHATPF